MSKAPEKLDAGQAAFLADPHLIALFNLIEAAGGELRVNGGAVRNALLSEQVRDVDLSTTLTPDRVSAVLQAGGVKVVATGVDHGTVTAVAGGRGYEITTLREDIETHGRHATVRFGTDWHADAQRRDFTMNALYCDRDGRLFDPLGGYGDLVGRQVRFIGDAAERIAEDYLRIFRFFRFFAWYGSGRPDAEGLKACTRLKGHLAQLSAERVWQELKRLLAAPDPGRAVLWMRTTGVLAVALPENGEWGVEALAGMVALGTARNDPPDPLWRLMSLLPPREERVSALSDRLKLSNGERARLAAWAGEPAPDTTLSEPAFEQKLYRGDPQAIADSLAVAAARERAYQGETSHGAALEARLAMALEWQRPVFPLKGRDLMKAGFATGPELGAMLDRLEDEWVEADFKPDRETLIESAKKLKP